MNTPNFRIAFRHEGDRVNCYLAKLDSMEGAAWIASASDTILMHPDTWAEYQEFMRHAIARAGAEVGDVRQRAPEHERAGSA